MDILFELVFSFQLILQEFFELRFVLLVLLLLHVFLLVKALKLLDIHLHLFFLGLDDRQLILLEFVVGELGVAKIAYTE